MSNPYLEDDPYSEIDTIPKTEGFLQRAIRGASGGMMAGGPSLAGMSVGAGVDKPEEGLPSGLQMAGNVLGGEVGLMSAGAPIRGGMIGGTMGRSIGEAGKQGIQTILDKKPFDVNDLAQQSAIGAGSEAISAPFGFVTNKMFSKYAGKEFRGKIGEKLGGIKDLMKRSGIKVPIQVVDRYRQIADELASKVQIHPDLSKIINNAADDLERVGRENGGYLNPDDIMRSEKYLSNELKKLGVFGEQLKKGDFSDVAELISAKKVAGETVQSVADKAGVGKDFSGAKKLYGKILSSYPNESSKHGILKNILEAGGINYMIRGKPLEAAGNIIASEAVGSDTLGKMGYNALKAGKLAPTGIAELLKSLMKDKNNR